MEKKSENEIKELYNKNFNVNDYYTLIHQESIDVEYFFMRNLAKIFANPEMKGSTLLELSSGPTIPHISFASKRFSHIVLSDFLQCNRDALRQWLNKETQAFDWSERLTLCAEFYGYKNPDAGRLEMESLIHANVKAVTECDFLADQIVPDQYNVPYDAVLTCRALGGCCPDYSTYKKCLKKINSLIKPNGFLILIGYLGATFYYIGNHQFPDLPLTHKEVQQALEDAGFESIEWRFFFNRKAAPGDANYYETPFCLHCVKSA